MAHSARTSTGIRRPRQAAAPDTADGVVATRPDDPTPDDPTPDLLSPDETGPDDLAPDDAAPDTATVTEAPVPDAEPADTAPPPVGDTRRPPRFPPPTTRAAALRWGLAALVLALVAVAAGTAWYQREYTGAAANRALVDVGATAQVAQQVGDALTTVYSFDYTRLAQNEADSRAVITPAFSAQFDQLFADVRLRAPQQQAVVTATVVNTAVRSIVGDTAVVVVFMDQLATRAAPGADAPQLASAGRLTVTATYADGRWRIADVVAR